MNHLAAVLGISAAALLVSCGPSRSSFAPDSGPPTVGMPAELSDRERQYIPEIDGALRNQGYLPVRHGRGDMELEFKIAEGPINTDTTITLTEERRVLAEGEGRAAGAPLIGRDKVARKSFDRAFEQFEAGLPGASGQSQADHDSGPAPRLDEEYVY